jgi:inward rectifier potassium channel
VRRDGQAIVALGGRRGGIADLYHGFLSIPMWGLILALLAVYFGLNLIFAGLYLIDPGGVANLKAGDFAGAFFFSVQTISTVGYGILAPTSVYANVIVTLECFVGLMLAAITTGAVIGRFSKPTARLMFSQVATITPFDGVPHLMFRVINERTNRILEAEVIMTIARQDVTTEGRTWRRLQDLVAVRQRSPLLALSWTIMHRVDETSPLFGATQESLIAEAAEIVAVVSGVDDIFAQRVHARYAYRPEDIIWDKEFENVLSVEPNGRWVLDYRKFHDLRDLPSAAPH